MHALQSGFTREGPGSCCFPASRRGERGQCCLRILLVPEPEALQGSRLRSWQGLQAATRPGGRGSRSGPWRVLLQGSSSSLCMASEFNKRLQRVFAGLQILQNSAHGKVGKSSRDKSWKVRPRPLPRRLLGTDGTTQSSAGLSCQGPPLWAAISLGFLSPANTYHQSIKWIQGVSAVWSLTCSKCGFWQRTSVETDLVLRHLRFPGFYCSPVKLLKICWVFLILQDRALSGSSLASQPLDQARKQQFPLKEKKRSLPYLGRTYKSLVYSKSFSL